MAKYDIICKGCKRVLGWGTEPEPPCERILCNDCRNKQELMKQNEDFTEEDTNGTK